MNIEITLIAICYITLGVIWFKLPSQFKFWKYYADLDARTFETLHGELQSYKKSEIEELLTPTEFQNKKYKIWFWASLVWPLSFIRFIYELIKYSCVAFYTSKRNKFYKIMNEEKNNGV